jgi:hypothetical protein
VQAKKQAVALLGAAGYEDKAAALRTKTAEDEEEEQQDWVRENVQEVYGVLVQSLAWQGDAVHAYMFYDSL